MLSNNTEHWYVFKKSLDNTYYIYERTCGTLPAAINRVEELKVNYPDALYFENEIPKNFEYFY